VRDHDDAGGNGDKDVGQQQAAAQERGANAAIVEVIGGVHENRDAECFNEEEADQHERRDDPRDDRVRFHARRSKPVVTLGIDVWMQRSLTPGRHPPQSVPNPPKCANGR
jgi:hypothetical protein